MFQQDDSDTVISFEDGTYMVIEQDTSGDSPREWDNFGTMICGHGRYKLGDIQDMDSDELDEIMADKKNIYLPIYMYEHSGIALDTKPFHCPWDSGFLGIIYVPREKARDWLQKKRITKEVMADIIKILEGEVKEYSAYLNGDCWGFTYYDEEGNMLDSCWGFIGDLDDVIPTMKENIGR